MLDVRPFRQRTGYCGPASLKMVMDFYGIKLSEKRIAKLSEATPSKGVELGALLKVAKSFGLKGFVGESATLADVRVLVKKRKIPVIVDWFSEDDGHYSPVVDIDRDNIYLQDPQRGHLIAMRHNTFRRLWFDFPGDYMVKKRELKLRKILVVYKPEVKKKEVKKKKGRKYKV